MTYLAFGATVRQLGPGVLTIGSAPEAGWRVLGHGLEPRHAIVSQETGWGGRALIERGSPSAVIVVNGAEVSGGRATLEFDDVVRLGTAEFTYRRTGPGAAKGGPYLKDRRRNRVYLVTERTTIGRDPSSTIVMKDVDVSRTHAEIVKEGDAFILRPHGVSVVSVNGVRVSRQATLREGDDISIADSTFRFTTDIGPSTAVSVEPRRDIAAGNVPRGASAQTMFMGAIEARDFQDRTLRKKITRGLAVTLTIVAVAFSLFWLAFSARRSSAALRHRHAAAATAAAATR
ncbi:MAG TPA: FHA domain-containing protein [Gemmatimonadaceae bacterium]|nr:FHA domain-containing protein [Gemmatimonadaceae bacterium]